MPNSPQSCSAASEGAPMKIWFDTEFIEDGTTIDLISIGMVRQDGATYYAETDQYRPGLASQWVKDNVLVHLQGGAAIKPRDVIAREIVEFAGWTPEFWAYYADYDWVALCQLYGTMMQLPESWPMFCRDVKQLCVDRGDPKLPKQDSTEHHALSDAIWTMHAWNFLQSMRDDAQPTQETADTVQFTDPQTATDTRLILAEEYENGLRKMEASGYEEWQKPIQSHKLVIEALRFQARAQPQAKLSDFAELKLLIDEYNPANSDWNFRKGVLLDVLVRVWPKDGSHSRSSAGNDDDILRKFADAFRSGAQGATMDCDDAQKMALAIDGLLDQPQAVGVPADQVARTLALSYGRNPDGLTEWTEMCDAHNRPVPIWKVYEEQAEALLATYSITRPQSRSAE